MMWSSGDGWWMLMLAWMAALVLTVAGIAFGVARDKPRRGESRAIGILKRRLASGEIDREEYLRHKQTFGETPDGPRVRVPPSVAGALIVFGVLFLLAAPVWVAASGNWDMWDHMGGMHGGGRNTSGSPQTLGGQTEAITIDDFSFAPGNLKVPVNATVTWTNRDSAPHDATDAGGTWRTSRLAKGESGSVTFDKAGEYDYYCSIHPSMKARLSVG